MRHFVTNCNVNGGVEMDLRKKCDEFWESLGAVHHNKFKKEVVDEIEAFSNDLLMEVANERNLYKEALKSIEIAIHYGGIIEIYNWGAPLRKVKAILDETLRNVTSKELK